MHLDGNLPASLLAALLALAVVVIALIEPLQSTQRRGTPERLSYQDANQRRKIDAHAVIDIPHKDLRPRNAPTTAAIPNLIAESPTHV